MTGPRMAAEKKAIRISSPNDLGRVLKHAAEAGESVLVDTDDGMFELLVHPAARIKADVTSEPSSEQVARSIAGIRKATGGWKDLVDAEDLTAYIYERRRSANRPPVTL